MSELVVVLAKRTLEDTELQTSLEAASKLLQKNILLGAENLDSFAILPLEAVKMPLLILDSVILDSRKRQTHQEATRT